MMQHFILTVERMKIEDKTRREESGLIKEKWVYY
jgi:hypothetical protein